MKIGILFTAYNCDDYIEDVLKPWLELRDELNLILVANSGMFSDYVKFGFEEKNENTLQILINNKLDFLVTTNGKNLLDEDSSRNICLEYLKKLKCDLLWTVDGDEVYSKTEIKNIIQHIKENSEPDVYLVQFKNYTLKYPYWIDGFFKETIYWMDRYGGINKFFFDNVVDYNDGTKITEKNNHYKIPKNISFVEHYSWLSSDSRSKEKVIYQNTRFFGNENERCSFVYINDELKFNEQFWTSRNLQIPILHETLSVNTTDFELDYNRENKTININNCKSDKTYFFEVWDSKNNLVYTTEINLLKDINFFIYPGPIDVDNFIKIIVKHNNFICHEEKLILEL